MASKGPKRYRVSVPLDDKIVLEWIGNQHNLSMSVRQLIKDKVLSEGLGDVFSSDIEDLKALRQVQIAQESNISSSPVEEPVRTIIEPVREIEKEPVTEREREVSKEPLKEDEEEVKSETIEVIETDETTENKERGIVKTEPLNVDMPKEVEKPNTDSALSAKDKLKNMMGDI